MDSILFVDDKPSILKAIKRLFALHDYEILTASSGEEALKIIAQKNISVLVSDQRMPGMLGTELLGRVNVVSPHTARIILSGYTDLDSLMGAINRGQIFRFIVKPWDEKVLLGHIKEGLALYHQNKAHDEKILLALAQTLELKDPYTKGHCDRVAQYAVEIGQELGLTEEELNDLRHGSWLHDCGKIGVHEDILNLPGQITLQQKKEIEKHPNNGAIIAEKADLSPRVINIIRYHHERMDGQGYPMGLSRADIPLEAKIVAVADVYDAISTDRPYRKACGTEQIVQIMQGFRGTSLDEQLVDLFMQKILQ